jgi:hypothetical protein
MVSEVGRLFCIALDSQFLQTVAVLSVSSSLNVGSEDLLNNLCGKYPLILYCRGLVQIFTYLLLYPCLWQHKSSTDVENSRLCSSAWTLKHAFIIRGKGNRYLICKCDEIYVFMREMFSEYSDWFWGLPTFLSSEYQSSFPPVIAVGV